MNNQKRTIMGACDYSLETLQNLKKDLSDVSAKNSAANWAIGGIVIALVSHLIQTCGTVFDEAAQSSEPNAKNDISEIQKRFNEFLNNMVNQE